MDIAKGKRLAAAMLKGSPASPTPASPELMLGDQRLAYEYEELVAEVERLQAMFPKTKDGVIISHGMKIYERDAFGNICPARVDWPLTATNKAWVLCGPASEDIDPTKCYSTRDAAEAAGGE
jgi:hypothetical protein